MPERDRHGAPLPSMHLQPLALDAATSRLFVNLADKNMIAVVDSDSFPRARVPDSWDWPVGVSLSTELGYQRAVYSPDTWTWEIRPIIDKAVGRWYFAVNPALERTLHGPDVNLGLD